MGWYIAPTPGSRTGPCLRPCRHRDCAQTRAELARPCPICQKAAEPGDRIYLTTIEGVTFYQHADCVEQEAEGQR